MMISNLLKNKRTHLVLFAALSLFVLNSSVLFAQETVEEQVTRRVQEASDHNYLSFSFENDIIGSGRDENYTSGARVTYFDVETSVPPILDELADAIPTFDLNPTTSTFFNFGQNLYTPANINLRQNQQNDRPWAAWAYGSVGLVSLTKNHLDELEFTLGIVGPEALGEQTQKFVHRHISDSDIPKGWSNQLEFEPGAILSWRRRWPIWKRYQFNDFLLRLEPDINLSLGNIYTYAGSGLSVSLSPLTSRLQDTPPRVRPAMAGTGFFDTPDRTFSWQLFAGVDSRAIARNIFLDGNTFKDSHNVDKKYFVGDANVGVALGFDDYRLSYTLNYRTKEFQGQKDPSLFGSVTLTTRF
ncbi:MAG: lipid A deacylase LpxR family protein [Alphaproteobacteria bacterium]|nr:lipid A deacylase LpxR family protein [Alphaproteobacteria bacterium]